MDKNSMKIFFTLLLLISHLCLAATDPFEKTILGRLERVTIIPERYQLIAKLDTGADMSSLSAHHIVEFEKNGEKWIRFEIDMNDSDEHLKLERPLYKFIRVKNRHENDVADVARNSRRPVVQLLVCFGGRSKKLDVNLVDRKQFEYPMLIGWHALVQLKAVVDPSIKHTLRDTCDYNSLTSDKGSKEHENAK